MERRISPSSPDFPDFDRLTNMIHVAQNPHIWGHFNQNEGESTHHDVDPVEQRAIVSHLKEQLNQLLNDVPDSVAELINKFENRK